MFLPRLAYRLQSALLQLGNQGTNRLKNSTCCKMSTHYRSGALKPKPEEMPFGLVAVFCAVIPGLFVGATISKNIANFLEENDLFVPADDDDDED